jgi:hypothetical protein
MRANDDTGEAALKGQQRCHDRFHTRTPALIGATVDAM